MSRVPSFPLVVPTNPNQNVNHPGLIAQMSRIQLDSATSYSLQDPFWSITVPRGSAISVQGIASGIKSDATEAVAIRFFVMAFCDTSGTATVVDRVFVSLYQVTDVTGSYTITETNQLRMELATAPTGIFKWTCSYQYQETNYA